MSAYWNSASNKFLVFVLLTFSLLGCKTTTPISNGQNIADLSGKAGNDAMFSVTVPENINGLLIEVAGSPDISLDLLDADKNSLGACVSATRCLLDHPSAAKYLIKLSATADYAGVNISASWGGPDEASLYNNVEITELAGNEQSLLLKSLYVGLNNGPVSFTTTGLNGATLEVADQYGDTLHTCESAESCAVNGLSEGLFFARILGAAEFTEGTLKASWGNPVDTTLRNGVKKAINGNPEDVILESLYLPEGASAIMVHSNSPGISLEIVDSDGVAKGLCSYTACNASGLSSGIYFVRATIHEANPINSSIVASWAGIGVNSMRNGDFITGLSLSTEESLLQSFYVDGQNTSVMLSGSENSPLIEIFNANGTVVSVCESIQPCLFETTQSGIYFIRAGQFYQPIANFSLAVSWANQLEANLNNGAKTDSLHLNQSEILIKSFFIEDPNTPVMLTGSEYAPMIEVFDDDGAAVAFCESLQPCSFTAHQSGAYFARAWNDRPQGESFNLSVAWANPATASLGNGDRTDSMHLGMDEIQLKSFFITEPNTDVLLSGSEFAPMIEVFAADGVAEVHCESLQPCSFTAHQSGAYFARAWNDRPQGESFNLSVAWANATTATLNSGDKSAPMNLGQNQAQVKSFFINEANTDVLLSGSEFAPMIEVIADDGVAVAHCEALQPCNFTAHRSGAYFARAWNDREQTQTFNLSVAWANPITANLNNGDKTGTLNLGLNEVQVKSFYISEPNTQVLLTGSEFTPMIEIFADDGVAVAHCEYLQPCSFTTYRPGSFFARAWNDREQNLSFNLSVAWANETVSGLTNGDSVEGLHLEPGEVVMQSMYFGGIELQQVLVMGSESTPYFEILDYRGDTISHCYGSMPCTFIAMPMSTFFVRAWSDLEEGSNFRVAAAWSSPETSTIENGSIQSSLSGQQGDVLVESLYFEEDTTLSLSITGPVIAEVKNRRGDTIGGCENTCTIDVFGPDSYFVTLYFMEDTNNASLQVSW